MRRYGGASETGWGRPQVEVAGGGGAAQVGGGGAGVEPCSTMSREPGVQCMGGKERGKEKGRREKKEREKGKRKKRKGKRESCRRDSRRRSATRSLRHSPGQRRARGTRESERGKDGDWIRVSERLIIGKRFQGNRSSDRKKIWNDLSSATKKILKFIFGE